jgi:phosphoribosyl 1,2-cyclic phosphodiesterase
MLKFICLGSGSSGNSYFLYTGEEGILIDAGIGIRTLRKIFKENGLALSQVKAVFVTHDHADHIKSVSTLGNDYNIPIYATQLVHQGIRRNYCVKSQLDSGVTRFIEKDQTVQFGCFSITVFDVPHDSTDNVGYSIDVGGINFCLITDAGHVTPQIAKEIQGANYLILEANYDEDMLKMGHYPPYLKERIASENGHLSNHDAAVVLAENMTEKLRHVWLCHLSEENNHPELARKTVDAILRSYGIIPGKDLILDVLRRRVPSAIYDL